MKDPAAGRLSARTLAFSALAAGVAARALALAVRPLWADEIFTLTLARKSLPGILAGLRVDSGPPLHYVVAHFFLLPFPVPGTGDVVVRLVSFAASLLHLPVLIRIGGRLGRDGTGLVAAALYAIFPLAVLYGAEGRGYALASLLALLAFERALALRDHPTFATGAALALSAAGAVLTHYIAAFPVVALALLAVDARPAARKALVGSGLAAFLLAAPWLPVALHQPAASMAWARGAERAGALLAFPANLGLGVEPYALALLFALLGGALVIFIVLRERRGTLAPAATVLAGSLALLAVAQILTGAIVLPGRTAVVLLPYVALLLAGAPSLVPLSAGGISLAFLVRVLPSLFGPYPGETVARLLEPSARAGKTIAAAGYWGAEIDYRLARAGLPGAVIVFPAAAAAHPGWYREEEIPGETLAREAAALLASPARPNVFVLPRGSRASAALASRLGPARRLLASPLVDVVETKPSPKER